ncbi:MAG: hypothetical protein J2P16_07335, partial [Mycobacterium sp.]|nr:hypothetical protein [Mycobacterium sp.]
MRFAAAGWALVVVGVCATGPSDAGAHGAASVSSGAAVVNAGTPIKHVIVYLLENHSFDSLLGPYCARRVPRCNGVDIGTKVRLANGAGATVKASPDIVVSINHEPFAQQLAWDDGKDDGWNQVPGCFRSQRDYQCISAYTPKQMFTLSALANQYALSDNTMTCDMVPSAADHFEWQTGCSLQGFSGDNPTKDTSDPLSRGGPGNGCISKMKAPWGPSLTPEPSCFPDYKLPKARYPNGGAFEPTPVLTTDGRTLAEQCAAHPPCTWTQYGATRADVGTRLQDGEKDFTFYFSTTQWFAQLYFTGLNHVYPAS